MKSEISKHDQLTELQRRVFEYIVRHLKENDRTPSRRDIAARFGVTVKTAHGYVLALQKKGWISVEASKSCGIKVIRKASLCES